MADKNVALFDRSTQSDVLVKFKDNGDGSYSEVVGTSPFTPSSIDDGRKIVTTAGTRVQLSASSVPCKEVLITAETDNTSTVVVGGSTCIAALATRRGIPLEAGESVVLQVDNLNKVYIDSLVSTEGVTFVYSN